MFIHGHMGLKITPRFFTEFSGEIAFKLQLMLTETLIFF